MHNVFPVGSAAIYPEAQRLKVPVIQYVHNFRPFSVSGYLWADGRPATAGLRRNYWDEIRHGTWQNSRLKTGWLALVLTTMHQLGWFNAVKAWIAISDFMRDRFIEAGVAPEKIFTLRHFWRMKESVPVTAEGDYYLFMGRLMEEKGVRVLVDAWRILSAGGHRSIPKLYICGSGPLQTYVQAEAEKNPAINFLGHVGGQEKHQLINRCRAMIVPSIVWEALGLVTYEAYDSAKPVLAAKSGGLTETVRDGVSGLLHKPGDSHELARQVREIDSSAVMRREMGGCGRDWLAQEASPDMWFERFLAIARFAIES